MLSFGGIMKEPINDLIMEEKWDEAKSLIEKELSVSPEDHWLLTQLGAVYYEQHDYLKAMEVLEKSYKIVPDCPLTLWHLAGTADALGQYERAITIYFQLLIDSTSPCWESPAWTKEMKIDCLYRLGLCFKNLSGNQISQILINEYLRQEGGTYPIEEVILKSLED